MKRKHSKGLVNYFSLFYHQDFPAAGPDKDFTVRFLPQELKLTLIKILTSGTKPYSYKDSYLRN